MSPPVIRRSLPRCAHGRGGERGVTMLLVAIAMVSIIAMAALSIDVVTLYLARQETQRSADAAALAAARVLSISGITGDPSNSTRNWSNICGAGTNPLSLAVQAAQAVAQQNAVGGVAVASGSISVTYSAGNGSTMSSSTTDCTTLASTTAFGENPMVTVKVTRASLPTFFSRIWGNSGNNVSATATAEAYNPSSSGSGGNQNASADTIVPVQPRCVKPWVVPNKDPMNPGKDANGVWCDNPDGANPNFCNPFVDKTTGQIQHAGISTGGTSTNGVIGETFWLVPDCQHGSPNNCQLLLQGLASVQPRANFSASGIPGPPNLLSAPGQTGTSVSAIPSCTSGDAYEESIEGCDAPTNYHCGVANAGGVDLTKHNPGVNSITDAVKCLIHQSDATNLTTSSGQDYLSQSPLGAPSAYPFQILVGSDSPLVLKAGLAKDSPISSSSSIVSLPIYDQTAATLASNTTLNVTFIGFLQVFINAVDLNGDRLVTVLNVTGCGNGTNTTGSPVTGSSPVPVRLVTPP